MYKSGWSPLPDPGSEKAVKADAASFRVPVVQQPRAPLAVFLETKEENFNNVHLSPSTKLSILNSGHI